MLISSQRFSFHKADQWCIVQSRVDGLREISSMSTWQPVIYLMLGLLLATYVDVSAEDWRFYARSEFGLYQYDAEDVSHLSQPLFSVHQKLILTDRGASHLVRELGKEYENARQIVTLREVDCSGKKSRIVGLTYCTENGLVIRSESYDLAEWDSITPDSVDDALYVVVCE